MIIVIVSEIHKLFIYFEFHLVYDLRNKDDTLFIYMYVNTSSQTFHKLRFINIHSRYVYIFLMRFM